MKYILMMNTPGGGPYRIFNWPKEDFARHIAFMRSFAKKLGELGELVSAEGLAGPDQAKRVRAGKDGQPITDGHYRIRRDRIDPLERRNHGAVGEG